MSELYDKSIHKLELDRVLELLADCAGSNEGKACCLSLRPVSDLEDVLKNASQSPEQVLFITGIMPSGKRVNFAVDLNQEEE